MDRDVAISFDVDWAPPFVVAEVASILKTSGVPSTWFVTHEDEGTVWLRDHPGLVEMGIHPNFLPGSTQGGTVPEVLRNCMDLVPNARCVRSHCLVQSTHIQAQVLEHTPVRTDCSLYLPHARFVTPISQWFDAGALLRVPFVWEDDLENLRPRPIWQLDELLQQCRQGPVVLNFHPILVFLNDADVSIYRRLRDRYRPLQTAPEAEVRLAALSDGLPGPRTMLLSVIDHVRRHGGACTISGLTAP